MDEPRLRRISRRPIRPVRSEARPPAILWPVPVYGIGGPLGQPVMIGQPSLTDMRSTLRGGSAYSRSTPANMPRTRGFVTEAPSGGRSRTRRSFVPARDDRTRGSQAVGFIPFIIPPPAFPRPVPQPVPVPMRLPIAQPRVYATLGGMYSGPRMTLGGMQQPMTLGGMQQPMTLGGMSPPPAGLSHSFQQPVLSQSFYSTSGDLSRSFQGAIVSDRIVEASPQPAEMLGQGTMSGYPSYDFSGPMEGGAYLFSRDPSPAYVSHHEPSPAPPLRYHTPEATPPAARYSASPTPPPAPAPAGAPDFSPLPVPAPAPAPAPEPRPVTPKSSSRPSTPSAAAAVPSPAPAPAPSPAPVSPEVTRPAKRGSPLPATERTRMALPGRSPAPEDEASPFGPALVVDTGSGLIKAGFAGERAPSVTLPTLVGRPKHDMAMHGLRSADLFVGDRAQERRGLLALSYPVEHGIIQSWDMMEKLWTYVFEHELYASPADHPCLLTEPPLNPKSNREQMTEIFFETYRTPALYIAVQAVLALYASGLRTALALDCGDGAIHAVPVYEGYALQHATMRLNMGGRELSGYLGKLLAERGHSFTTSAEFDILRSIKENLAYVAHDYQDELKLSKTSELDRSFTLPDGKLLKLGNERFRCTEPIFQPALIGLESPGIHEIIFNAIMRCDIDTRQSLWSNVVLSGGTTLFPGFEERLRRELKAMCPPSVDINIAAPDNRAFSVWLGGSILASLPNFPRMWITKEDYDENGPTIVHKKCF